MHHFMFCLIHISNVPSPHCNFLWWCHFWISAPTASTHQSSSKALLWHLTCNIDWSTYSNMRTFWTLRNSWIRAGVMCAVVINWAKEVEQQPWWWWWWWHHPEAMPRQTHLRAHIVSHSPLPAFKVLLQLPDLSKHGLNPYSSCFFF